MQVGRWGKSLAVRIPSSVVESMRLKEGDEVAVVAGPDKVLEMTRDSGREEAILELRALSRPMPAGFRFSRDDANSE